MLSESNQGGPDWDIAYCAPVMNRMGDLEKTLAHNIRVLSEFSGRARLIVACFDESPNCAQWIRREFSEALDSGLLELRELTPLPHWHFSWAKNAFAEGLNARYYSSLDGDNFLSTEEVEKTLTLIEEADKPVLIHHFSGHWGDGTSGRITVPAELYTRQGYLNEIMPRQFDEMGVMLYMLAHYPELTFISRPGVDIFELSGWAKVFRDRNGLTINHQEEDLGRVPAPENPRGADYVRKDPKLDWFQNLNATYTGWRCSTKDDARQAFLKELTKYQEEYARQALCAEQPQAVFRPEDIGGLSRSSATTLYAVNRNHFEFIQPWLSHYRRLGVERFVIVDDGSDEPLADHMQGDDVIVVRPAFGQFRTSKAFWLKVLMMCCQEVGSWAMVADIDEFIDIPGNAEKAPLKAFLKGMPKQGRQDFVVGMLLDMMPDDGVDTVPADGFVDHMNQFYYRPPNSQYGYSQIPSVKWAFSEAWSASFAVDVRFRLYGTIDCLRKVPLFRFDPKLDLNQGFHTLARKGRQLDIRGAMQEGGVVLPIRHYKMAKVFSDENGPGNVAERREQYFGRTAENLARIQSADPDYVRRVWQATPFKRRYQGPESFPFLEGVK